MNLIGHQSVGLLILAGGQAVRMQSVLHGRPKALIQFPPWRPPILDLAIRASRLSMEVCVATDYQSHTEIEAYLSEHNQKVSYSREGRLGTGSAIAEALPRMSAARILICNADTIVPADILQLANELIPRLPILQVLTPRSTQNSGLIGIDIDGGINRVTHWGERSATPPCNTAVPASSTGVYVIDRRYWMGHVNNNLRSLELDVLPACVDSRDVEAYLVKTLLPTFDFGTPERSSRLRKSYRLLTRLYRSSGSELPPPAGYCLSGVKLA